MPIQGRIIFLFEYFLAGYLCLQGRERLLHQLAAQGLFFGLGFIRIAKRVGNGDGGHDPVGPHRQRDRHD